VLKKIMSRPHEIILLVLGLATLVSLNQIRMMRSGKVQDRLGTFTREGQPSNKRDGPGRREAAGTIRTFSDRDHNPKSADSGKGKWPPDPGKGQFNRGPPGAGWVSQNESSPAR